MEIKSFIHKLEEEFEELEKGTLEPTTSFRDLEEWSSMYALILIALMETEYEVAITGEDLNQIETVQDLFHIVEARRKAS